MISVPGKIFIIGEYHVMNGGAAVLASLKPEFECSWKNTSRVHPESPAGKFLDQNSTAAFLQVGGGLGAGFGSSTAELIAANEYLSQPWDEAKLWTWYREKFLPASGADLVVQNQSRKSGCGFYQFQIEAASYRADRVKISAEVQSRWFLFHAPATQKTPTYLDLESGLYSSLDFGRAARLVQRWTDTFDPLVLTEWALLLNEVGLESRFASEVRHEFEAVPGVAGVKGCGAGLNDMFLVCLREDSTPEVHLELHSIAERFFLKVLGSVEDHV